MAECDFHCLEEARTHPQASSTSRSASLPPKSRGSRSHPLPPPFAFPRVVHYDGSFSSVLQVAAYGITIADSHGQVYDGEAETLFCSYMIQAEAVALLNAVVLAAQVSCPTCVKSDCEVLATALKKPPDLWPWQCRATLARVIDILHYATWITVEFTLRCFNGIAYWVAKSARESCLPVDWITIANLIEPLCNMFAHLGLDLENRFHL
ncbi:unnamed protein product [Linum trigynum]|uniref:RNase H type-1 domain-containing protein n=1 Tax=Linum trigynum TaxID=586398 RepID=A0AAV2EER3_9ROSI